LKFRVRPGEVIICQTNGEDVVRAVGRDTKQAIKRLKHLFDELEKDPEWPGHVRTDK
jgi:hypothetical protein